LWFCLALEDESAVILRIFNAWMNMSDIDEVADFDYRLVIEMAAAAMAAQRCSGQALERIARKLDDLLGAQTSTDFERADLSFREAIGIASGNRHLLDAISRHDSLKTISARDREVRVVEYQMVYCAIESGDSEFAKAAVHHHLTQWRKRSGS